MQSGMTRRGLVRAAPIFMAALALALAPSHPAQARIPPRVAARRAQARLRAVQAQIARIAQQVERSRIEQGRLTRALRTTEQSAGAARAALAAIRRQRAALAVRRTGLAARRQASQADLARTRRRAALACSSVVSCERRCCSRPASWVSAVRS